MSNAAATLEPTAFRGNPMAAEPNPQTAARPETMRFTHATGARPLDGYTIKRGVGVGGFGEVYYALSDAGKEVALKRIQRHLDVELRGVRQCLNLKHVNLLSLFDIRYDDRGEAWVIMEYMLGESLRDVLERHPDGLNMAEVRRWFCGVAAGVAYLHDHGIVHRDLKPGNIFDDQGIVKLGDYGLSKFISCSRRSGQTESVGTFHYMAPEIGRGSYGKEIDVYALGIVLYELLTGRVPFDGESSQEIIMKHLTADPDLSAVPAECREPIRRALLKDPEQRYRDVREMLTALRWTTSATDELAAESLRTRRANDREPLVIGEDSDEIVFGPVRNVVDAEIVHEPRPRPHGAHAARTATQAAGPWEREPIAVAARQAVRKGVARWQQSPAGLPIKIIVLVCVGIVVLSNAHLIVPLAISLGVMYLVYLGVWMLAGGGESTPSASPAVAAAPPQPVATVPEPIASPAPSPFAASPAKPAPVKPVAAKKKSIELLRPWLAQRSLTERTAETLSSFLVSAGVVAVLSLLALLVGGTQLNGSLEMWALYAWMCGFATAASWTVLLLGKLWETSTGDNTHRRFVMLVAGLALGFLGYGLDGFLNTPLMGTGHQVLDPTFHQFYSSGVPMISAWLAHFAVLMAVVRWWRQADPLRSTRLSLWSVAVTGGVAGVLHQFVPLHQPWVLSTAIVASVAIQLAAPWVPPQFRSMMRSETANAV